MYKEGDFILPVPQTSRKRGETSIEVFLFPVVPSLCPTYHLRK